MKQPPTGLSYLRFLMMCGAGFALGGSLLIVLGSFVFDPDHDPLEAHNIEAFVAWIGGSLSFAVAFFFAALAVFQWKKIMRMRSMASSLLVEGQENTLYQAVHNKEGYHRPPGLDDETAIKEVI